MVGNYEDITPIAQHATGSCEVMIIFKNLKFDYKLYYGLKPKKVLELLKMDEMLLTYETHYLTELTENRSCTQKILQHYSTPKSNHTYNMHFQPISQNRLRLDNCIVVPLQQLRPSNAPVVGGSDTFISLDASWFLCGS